MAELLIRDIEPEIVERLKLRAKLHHRSLQGELKTIIEAAAKVSISEAKKMSESWRKRLSKGTFSDSAELLRKDRNR